MGLSRSSVAYLMDTAKRQPFSGRILTLGRLNVAINADEIEALAAERGFNLAPPPESSRPTLEPTGVSCDYLFRRLGFDSVHATDVSDYEGAEVIFDLNAAAIPPEHAGQYDVVLDSGTLEHIFHLPNALKNILDFTKKGGRIIHISPSSNHVDHGFFMFSPTFFWDFYKANDLKIHSCDLFRYNVMTSARAQWQYGPYTPGSLDNVSSGGLGAGSWGIAVIAEKVADIPEITIPQQGMYLEPWQTGVIPPSPARPRKLSLDRRIRDWFLGALSPTQRIWLRALRKTRFPLRPDRWI